MKELTGYENKPEPTEEQCRLIRELRLPKKSGQTLRRFDIRKLFTDPRYISLRRYIQTSGTMTIQAREGIDTDWNEVYSMTIQNEPKEKI
jgi:hypothetical protein